MAASMAHDQDNQFSPAPSHTKKSMSMEFLIEISEQFFEMVPARRMKWKDEEADMLISSTQLQQNLLTATVRHPLCSDYPPSISYRKHFMKLLINKLESEGAEICDEIYEAYAELLPCGEDEEDNICYKSYKMPCGNRMSLKESTNLVSNGTTGLSTWQAAQNLSEWLIENPHTLSDKTVLELGSGQGLTGLVVCTQCKIKSFTFSDCHPQVLHLLSGNIERNLSKSQCAQNSHEHDQSNVISDVNSLDDQYCVGTKQTFEGKEDEILLDSFELEVNPNLWDSDISHRLATFKQDTRVSLCHFDWECVKERLLEKLRADIILAADVVFDSRITPALVYVLKRLLEKGPTTLSKPVAYIASTIRNEDTRDDFLIAMGSEGLSFSIVEPTKKQLFHYDRSVPIEILKIYID